jgi:hypothetical protein
MTALTYLPSIWTKGQDSILHGLDQLSAPGNLSKLTLHLERIFGSFPAFQKLVLYTPLQ